MCHNNNSRSPPEHHRELQIQVSQSTPNSVSTRKHTSSVKHKPTPASTIGRPRWVIIRLIKKQPGTYGLPTCDIAVKNTFPAVCDVCGFSLEPGLPFFGAVLGRAQERGCRREGKHVDAVDVLDYVAEVSGVIRLVFKVLFIVSELAPQVIAGGK